MSDGYISVDLDEGDLIKMIVSLEHYSLICDEEAFFGYSTLTERLAELLRVLREKEDEEIE